MALVAEDNFRKAMTGIYVRQGVIMTKTASTLYAITLLRLTSGIFLLTHGLIKLFIFTPAGTVGFFESIGFPGILAYPVIAGEIGLGLALILGIVTRWAAVGNSRYSGPSS